MILFPTEKAGRSRALDLFPAPLRLIVGQRHRPTCTDIFEAFFDLLAECGTIGQQGILDVVFCDWNQHRGRSPMRGHENRVASLDGPEHFGILGLEFPHVGEFHERLFCGDV